MTGETSNSESGHSTSGTELECAICTDPIESGEPAVGVATGEVFHERCTGESPQKSIADWSHETGTDRSEGGDLDG